MNVAAIDIGSNACRLLINEVKEGKNDLPEFTKLNLIRVPLRLGMDVFTSGKISDERYKMLEETLNAYSFLMKAYQVLKYKIYATSAMRDAINSQEILQKLYKNTGLKVEIISGQKEASLISFQLLEKIPHKENDSLILIDVGGGSTEITVYRHARIQFQRSFELGTIRLLKNTVKKEVWDELKRICKQEISEKENPIIIGTGGNINKLFSLSKNKEKEPLSLDFLLKIKTKLESLSIQERMLKYSIKEDRADVIVPALEIYSFILKYLHTSEIHVPKIGLADGMIRELYEDMTEKTTKN